VPQEEAYAAVGSEPVTGGGGARFLYYLYCRQHGLWPIEVAGYNPDGEPERFAPYCPEQNVGSDYPPTILFHGDNDTDVPHALSVRMADALARAGVEHELITIPGGGHGCDGAVDNPAVRDGLTRIRAFLRRHLAG
jgi:dipeptidyl aminopeptidase/acylaminoacyl peptidase